NAGYNGGGLFDRFGALIGMAVLRKGKGEAADYVYPVQSFLETKNAKVPATQTPKALGGNMDRKPEAIAADATATARVTATIPAPTAAKSYTSAPRSMNDASSVRDPAAAVAAPGEIKPPEQARQEKSTVVSNTMPTTDAAVDVRSPRIQNSDYRKAVKDYLELIVRASTHQVVYPEEARHARWTGTSSIVFRVKSGGEISESYVDKSSGYAALDVTALLAVRKAIAETPPPAIVKDRGMTATVAIAFVLPEK
ncbi:MAG: TonB family protein, partial [Betaproteobacteria bacterium]